MTFEKKRNDIHIAAKLAGLNPPPDDDKIWDAQKNGFTRTAMRYHSKYGQFWLITLFAISAKSSEEPESLVIKPQIMH